MSIIKSIFRPAIAPAIPATPSQINAVSAAEVSVQRPHVAGRREQRRLRRDQRAA
jgi:hypothetical protein